MIRITDINIKIRPLRVNEFFLNRDREVLFLLIKMKIGSVFVTGANRGIGLEFVRQFSELEDPPSFIFATYRDHQNVEDLKKIQDDSVKSKVILIKMDVTVQEEIELAKQIVERNVGDRGLNLLINNAGLAKAVPFPHLTPENLDMHFKTNTVGPIMVLQMLFPLLEKAASASEVKGMSASRAAVLNLTSMVGSIQKTGVEFLVDLNVPSYKISKAALNMAMRVIAAQEKDKGILIVVMCPGWVKTDMGGKETAQIEPEESISDMIKTLAKLNETHHGCYMDRLANLYPF